MDSLEHFLQNCAFYPCSGLHGTPIKFLGSRIPRFFYADYLVSRDQLTNALREPGLHGYRPVTHRDLTPESLFGLSWHAIRTQHRAAFEAIHFDWADPFITHSRLERTAGFDDSHGPPALELLFARCEAITTLRLAFNRRRIAPRCVIHVRSGIGFGGNFRTYPQMLGQALQENAGGLPDLLMYDSMGGTPVYGDYLDLVQSYREVSRWGYRDGGFLALAERQAVGDMPRAQEPASPVRPDQQGNA